MSKESKISRVALAIRELARAEASSVVGQDLGSMGTYYEEKEVIEALSDLLSATEE
jgi:hypothetical protein